MAENLSALGLWYFRLDRFASSDGRQGKALAASHGGGSGHGFFGALRKQSGEEERRRVRSGSSPRRGEEPTVPQEPFLADRRPTT